jgi:hypothetical protein
VRRLNFPRASFGSKRFFPPSLALAGGMNTCHLHADSVHVLACRDVQRAAVAIAEGDVGRAYLRLRLAGRNGQLEHAEPRAFG